MSVTFFLFVVSQLFPSYIPDLSFGSPLMVSGRYKGDFPDNIKVTGMLADMSTFVTDLKVQNAKDVPFDRVNFSTPAVKTAELFRVYT